MPNNYWLKTLFFLCAFACFGETTAQVRFKVALSSDSTRYQVSLYSETGPFSQSSANIISSSAVTLIAPTGELVPTSIEHQTGIWSGPSTFVNPVGELNRDYFVFTLNNPNSDIVFTPGLEVNLFSFANNLSCAGAVELMDNDNDPLREQDPTLNVGNQITIVNFGQTNAYTGAYQPGSANCMGAPTCDLTITSVSKTDIASCGGNDGMITISVANPTGTLLYSIDNGINWFNTPTFSNLGIGNYTIKVKDDLCEQTYDSNPVSIVEPGITVQVTDSIPASCNTTLDGQITVVASGGLPPYEYSINNGANWTTNGTFSSLGNGIFTVKARNADSTCETTYPNLIVFSTQGINIEVDKTDVSCTSGANGTIDISAAGSIGTFNYSIDSGQMWLATSSFSDLAGGNYYVFVRNSNGDCASAYTNNPVVINENAINYTVTATDPPCTGGAQGSIVVALNGGEVGNFEYSKDNGVNWSSRPTFFSLDIGIYNIVVRKDGGGCESPYANNPVVLTIAPINISVTTIAGGCENDMTNRILVSASGGTGTFQYSNDDGMTWQASNIFENLANGDYILKVRNSDESCETAYAVNPVSFTGSAINIGLNTIQPSCNSVLDGSITISAFDGTGSYIYSIDDGVNYSNLSSFTGLGNGMYTIKVKNADGTCTTTYANNPIQFNTPALALVAAATEASCLAASDGTVSMIGNGGTGTYEFSIDSGATWSQTANYQNLAADLYYLQMRNANGTCQTAYANNPVDLRPDALALSLVSNTPPSCENGNDGSLVLTATGGGTTTYEFSIDDGMTWQSVGIFQNLSTGAYLLKVKISNTNCITTYPNNPVMVVNPNCPDPTPIDTCLLTYILTEANGVYTVFLKTDTTWTGNSATTSNAQVSIRVPTNGFQIGNISNKINGATFAVTGEELNPMEAIGFDFFAFTLQSITSAIPYVKGDTVALFSFENVGQCIGGAINLVGEGAIAEPAIDNINFDAQITVAGWGDPDAPICSAGNTVPICESAPIPDCVVNLVLTNQEHVFTVGMISDTTWIAPSNTVNSAQVTLRIPANGYTIENLQHAITGVDFDITSRQNSPSVEVGYDYLSLTLNPFGTTAIPFNKGVLTNLFSFEINDACLADSISLVGNGSAFAFPNGENDNLTSQMTVLGWTMADVPLCVQTEAKPICNFGIDLVLKSNANHCGASDGTLAIGTICTGGQTQYSIDNGLTYQTNSEFNNLPAGDYFVKIRNTATNCEISYDQNPVSITDGRAISFTATRMLPTCADSTNGSITLSAINGSNDYQYSIDDGFTWSLTSTFASLGNGTYLPKISNLDTTCITDYDTTSLILNGISCIQDSDGDGQFDVTEDLNMDGNLENDDTDGDDIPNYLDDDDDGDGVLTAMEEAGPNEGDSNGDGTLDCLQVNVATTQDGQGAYRTLEVSGNACQMISEFIIHSEGSMSEADPNYDFPFQLNAFTIPCGGTVTINLYFHNVADLADFTYRKYGPTIPGGAITAWYDFPITRTQETIGGLVVGKVTFQLTDGEIGDATGVDNMIVDPGGIAMNVNNTGDCPIVYDLEKIGETYMVSLTSDTSLATNANLVDSAKITLRGPTGVLDVINFTNSDINVLFELDTTYVAPVATPNYDYFVFKLSAASIGTNNINIFQDLKEPLFSFENGDICSFDSLFLVGMNAPFTTPIIGGEDVASAISLSGWNAPSCVTNTGGLFCLPAPRDTLELSMFAGLVNDVCLTETIQLPNEIGTATVLFQGAAVSGGMLSDSCIQLLAQENFVGRDFVTVVFCDAMNANICDTTVLDITVIEQPTCLINFFIEDSMGTFQCKMVSDTTWNMPLNEVISAQFTIRTPSGSFELANLQNGIGVVDFDLQTTNTQGGYDYLNIVLQTLNTQDIPFQKGDTVCLFSFENSQYCTSDSLFLIGEGSPVAAPEVGDEPIFSKLAIQGWGGGTQSVPACVMNYGLPICPIITPITDTIHFVMEENDTTAVCIDSVLQLLNRVGIANVCIQGMNVTAAVANNDSCVTLQAPPNFVGNDTLCVFHFDIGELGFRDTTIFVITVNEKPSAPTDTVNFTISDTMDVCLGAALQLNNIGAASILSTGNQVNVIVNATTDCITLQPVNGFVGNDTLQVIHCDANAPTFCDTTIIVVTVEAPSMCLFEYLLEATNDVYTVRLVVGVTVPSNLSFTRSMLTAIRVPATGFNVPTDSINTLLAGAAFENNSNGVILDEEEPNYGYILFDIGNIPSPTYQQGDTLDLFSFRGSNCTEDPINLVGPGATFPNPIINTEEITSFLSIGAYLPESAPYCVSPIGGTADCTPIVVDPDPAPRDTLHYVLDFETPRIVCIDSALQLLNAVGNVTVCEQGSNVTVNVINGDSCVTLTPATNFSGNDTLCIVYCDAMMTDFCDTTILVITVNPNNMVPPPAAPDSTCALQFDLRLTDGVYVVRMTSDTTIRNTTHPFPNAPNPFSPAATNLMDITFRAPTGQLQIVNQIDFDIAAKFVLKSSIISPVENPAFDYFVFGLNPDNTPTVVIPYQVGISKDLFSFQNANCNLDSIALVGRGTSFDELVINGTNINTKVVANLDTIATCVNDNGILPPALALSTINTAPTTGVCNDGMITVTATNGTGIYEYSINDGTDWFSNNEFTNLENGIYLVKVRSTDQVCVSNTDTVTLQNVDCAPVCMIVITSVDSLNASCDAANGSLTVNATGTNLQYSINTGTTFQSNNVFENVAAGTYNIVVRDSVETTCEANLTVTLNGTTLPVIQSVDLTDASTFTANQGVLTIFATGSGTLKYSIDGGQNFFDGNAFTSLGTGTYTVVVTNGDESCPVAYGNNPIQIDQLCSVDVGVDRTICPSAAVALSASGTAPIFGWLPTTGLSCTDCPNPIANPDTTTTYIVTNSGGGCFVMDTITVTVSPTITADYNFMTSCIDLSIQFMDSSSTTGTITDYAWDFGDSNLSTAANPNHTYAAAGSYTVRLTTTIAGGCEHTAAKLIVVGDGLMGTVSDDVSICTNDCAQLMASGGTSYAWTPAEGLSATDIADPMACPTETTIYYVTISNGVGCTTMDSVTVTIANPTIGVSAANSMCGENNGVITIFASLSGAALEFQLFDNDEWYTTNSFTNLAAGEYNVRVRKTDGSCVTAFPNNPVVIGDTPGPVIDSITANNPTDCNMANGTIDIATAGADPLLYSIDDGANWSLSSSFSGLGQGNYAVRVANSDTTCISVAQIIELNPAVAPIILAVNSTNPTTCANNDGFINIEVDAVAAGNNAFEFSLDGINWQVNNLFDTLTAGTYSVFVRYENLNCITEYPTTITLSPANPPVITAAVGTAPSTVDANDGTIEITATGESNLEYSIDNGGMWQVSNMFNGLDTGSYDIMARYTDESCPIAHDSPLVLSVDICATITAISSMNPEGCGINTGLISIVATGINDLEYSINNGESWQVDNSFSDLDIGMYRIVVRHIDGTCETPLDSVITLNSTGGIDIREVIATSPTGCVDNNGSIEILADGGINLEYSIDNGDTWHANNVFNGLSTDAYTIVVRTMDEICQTTYDDPIFLIGGFELVITSVDTIHPSGCGENNGNITITATGDNNLEYSIDNGDTWQLSNVFDSLSAGIYTIVVRTIDGFCPTVYHTPLNLTENNGLVITNIRTHPDECTFNTGVITITAVGGNNLEYSINNGASWQADNNFMGLNSGTYTVLVRTMDSLCQVAYDMPVVIMEFSRIDIIEVVSSEPDDCGGTNGSISILAESMDTLEYSIDGGGSWHSNNLFTNLPSGTYTVLVRTVNLFCQAAYDTPVVLMGSGDLIISDVASTNPTDCGGTDGTITITAAGPNNLEYSIDNGGTWHVSNTFDDLPADTYAILVRTTDALCEVAYNTPIVLIGSGDLIISDVASTNPTDCGGTDGLIIITASGANNLEYSIDNGVNWQPSNVFNNLPAATYTILVRTTDALCEVAYNTPVILMGSGDLVITEVLTTNSDDCGANNGSITINAIGANILLYSINNGATFEPSNTFTNLAPGTYSVLVQTTDNFCQATYTEPIVITGSQPIAIIDVFSSQPSGVDTNDGLIEIFASGSDELEYSIDNGTNWQASNIFEGLDEGVYTILVRYTNGTCVETYSIPLILSAERCLVFIDAIAHGPQGCGSNDGHIFILTNVVGDNVEYSINNGIDWQNVDVFENLSAGEYTVLARRTDIACQIALDSTITLEEGEELMIFQVDAIDRDICNNFGGEIFINANLFNNIEFSINNGADWQPEPFFSNVDTGTYIILARSLDLSCQATYDFPVRINAVQNIEIYDVLVSNPTNCNNANGSIAIEANVGFNSEFSIDNGVTWQVDPFFTNLLASTYQIKLRTGSCEIDYVGNPVILGTPNAFSVITPIPSRAICTDTLMAISVILSDLIDSYQVNSGQIANPVLNGTTLTFDAVVTDLFNEYEITFTNAIGCEVTESFIIFQAVDTEADFVVIEPYCREMEVSLLFTGTATPMADLIWELDGGVLVSSSPATATDPAGKEIVVRWDNEGSRLIKLTVNDGGCIDDEYESIFVRKLPLVNAGADVSICMGDCVELEGSGTGVWYEWSPAAGLNSTTGPNVTACPTETTTYTLTVMSADGCVSVDSVTVNVETGFMIMTEDVTICEGTSTQLQVSGGTTYTWFPGVTLNNPNIPNPIATPAVTTLYKVVSTNENGCIDTAYVTVFVNPTPEAVACEDKTICRGDSIQLIVTTHAQYSWSPTNTLLNPNSGTPIAFPTETTTYTVTVTDENGCTDTDEVIVFVNTPPTVNAGNDVTICANASTRLNASGAMNYTWSPALSLSNSNITNPLATPSTTTTYTVTGTTANGCSNTDQVTVFVMESIGISAGNDVTICEGNIVQLNAFGGSNYAWSPSTGLNNPNIANPIATPTVTTTYTVTGVSANGCPAIDVVTIFVNPKPEAIACEDKMICRGESIQLIVTTHAQYSWSPTNTLLNPTSGTPTAFPTETTTYTVTVTDENGCTDTDEVVVFVNTPNSVDLGPDVTLCGGGVVPLDAGAGVGYQWSPTTGLSNPNSRNPIASVSNTTTYTVQVTNANGCVGTDDITININNGPNADAGPAVVLCPGGSGQLMASGGVNYQWSPTTGLSNPNIANPIVTATQVTNYQVTVTDEFGCTATDETLVTVSLPLAVDPIITNASCCGTGGSATLNVSGGFGNATFSWSPNVSTTNTATNLAAGFYKVIVTDAGGCSIIFTFEIKEDCNGCPDMFPEEERCISDTTTTEQICIPIALGDLGGYEILVGGNIYQPDHGCAHENLTAYSYALVEGQGNTGMYQVENWEVNGQMYATEVETMEELTFWMNTVDPGGNWINNPSILTIIGGNPNKIYGTMKVIQLTKWIETMLQPDVTGIATSSIIEVDVNTMTRPIEVIITNSATCCSDTTVLTRCGEEQPCVEEIIAQNQFEEMIDCGETATICLDIPFSTLNNYDLEVTNGSFEGIPLPCNYDSMFAYTYFTLPGQGAAGPYKVTNWIVDGQMYSGMFNTLREFAQLMNQIDPTGNWKLDVSTLTIQGGSSMTDYGAINIEQTSTGSIATLEINSNLIPMGTELTFASGNYEVLINNKNSGCRDRFLVNVSCDNVTPPTDTMITPVDTMVTPPTDTMITPVDTMVTPPTDTMITPVDTMVTPPTDTMITPVDTMVTPPTDTMITPVDTMVTPPTDTMITPVDTMVTPPTDTMITPVDTMTEVTCVDFITEEVLFAMVNRCDSMATFCIAIPFAEINQYAITVDGQAYQGTPTSCADGTAFDVRVGGFSFLFENLTTGCKDSIILGVTCSTSPREEVVTLEEAETVIYCPESDDLIGDIVSIINMCPEETGLFTSLMLDTIDYCVNVTGLLAGEEKACLVVCDANGICDTTYLTIQVRPKVLLNPIAERDIDTTEASTMITIDVLANDSIFGILQNMEILMEPANGTATFNLDNTISYTPNDDYCNSSSPDLIMYGICNDNGCDTAMIEIWVPCGNLEIKNGFSPNNDGINDYFRINGLQNFPNNSLKIFNRWGSKVFSQQEYKNQWNGTFEDKDLPDGTYFYIFEDGKGKKYSGWVQINR